MSRCTHTPQDPSLQGSCLAACIQSFLIDNNKPPRTQKEMIELATAQGLYGGKDYVLAHNMEKFCALFRVHLEEIKDRKIPREIANDEGVLIGSWNYKNTGQWHCVRFCGYVGEKKFRVMNPAASVPEDVYLEMETTQIDDWKCSIFSIRLKDSQKTE
jgi:hypothetical protein